MKKFLKFGAVVAALVLGLCLTGCSEMFGGENGDGFSGNVPTELTPSNATEVLGEDYKTKTSIKIPNGVKKIDGEVFANSSTIQSINIPESVTYIGDHTSYGYGVFQNCTALKSVTLPSGLTYLGDYAFKGCSSLESVSIPEGIPSIKAYVFQDCISLKSITFPSSITTISYSMCESCLSLTSVTIPEGVKEIGENSFKKCTALRNITLPASTLKIYDYAFDGCTALDSITVKAEIPPELSVGWGSSYAFRNNKTGRKIYVPKDSVEVYKAAKQWSNYADDIEAIIE